MNTLFSVHHHSLTLEYPFQMTNFKSRWVFHHRSVNWAYRTDSRHCSKINCPPLRIPCQLSKKTGSIEFNLQRVKKGREDLSETKCRLCSIWGLSTIPFRAITEASSIWIPDVQAGLPLRRGCPNLPWSSEQVTREGTQALSQEGRRAGSWAQLEARLLYPCWSHEMNFSLFPFSPLER